MNTFTKTEVFLSVFEQKRSNVNGALGGAGFAAGPALRKQRKKNMQMRLAKL